MKSEVIVLDRGIFLSVYTELQNNHRLIHTMTKNRFCKIIIVINNHYLDIWISPGLTINARVRGEICELVWRFKVNALCVPDTTCTGHYEKSLLRDNDPQCRSRKMKIISSDWIALSHRLLMYIPYYKFYILVDMVVTSHAISF